MNFALHPKLQADTFDVATLALCRVQLMNDARFPWLILIPMRPDLTDLDQLSRDDLATAMADLTAASKALRMVYRPDKLNVGVLGNMVPQLHIHVVARYRDDLAWPGPVWGSGQAQPYTPAAAVEQARLLQPNLPVQGA
jgi:diadenosine tetraphosphate (Ap4A) HIT family hydrolase